MPTLSYTFACPLPPDIAPELVVQALHRYDTLITPNPYLAAYHRRPLDLAEIVGDAFFREDGHGLAAFQVTERIVLVPGLASTHVVIPCVMQRFENGLRSRALASGGVRVWSTWSVVPAGKVAADQTRKAKGPKSEKTQKRPKRKHHGSTASVSHDRHGRQPLQEPTPPATPPKDNDKKGASPPAAPLKDNVSSPPPPAPPKDNDNSSSPPPPPKDSEHGPSPPTAPPKDSETPALPVPLAYELVEEARVECNAFVKPFVGRSFQSGHLEILRKVIAEIVQEQKDRNHHRRP